MKKLLLNAVLFLIGGSAVFAQENSPYTRYGLGDPVPNANVISRAMGGISAAVVDFNSSINAVNPATYAFSNYLYGNKGQGGLVGLDFGIDIVTRRTLENTTGKKFKSSNGIINYVNIGFPVRKNWAVNIGFSPETRINYKVSVGDRISSIDSIRTIYTGEGGAYKAFVGTGWKFKNFGVGFNFGYLFGTKDVDTKRLIISDTVLYKYADYNTHTRFGNIYSTLGLYQAFILRKATEAVTGENPRKAKSSIILSLGAYATIQPALRASQDIRREAFVYDGNGGQVPDTVLLQSDIKGDIKYPATIGFGAVIEETRKWMLGLDFVSSNWSNYRFYGQPDLTGNAWQVKLGAQVFGKAYNSLDSKDQKFIKALIYRAGLNFGTDPYLFNGKELKTFSATVGLGIPLPSVRSYYFNQRAVLNTSFEFGSRGSSSDILKENYFRIAIGISFSDRWFSKAKYY